MENLNKTLLGYYIVDRKNGKYYDPFLGIGNFLFAYSNVATDKHPFRIDINRLTQGLARKKYRLSVKNIQDNFG